MNEPVKLTFSYYDHYELPIYKDPEGNEWIDVSPLENMEPEICEYEDGMPNDHFPKEKTYEFYPERKVYPKGTILKMTWLVLA